MINSLFLFISFSKAERGYNYSNKMRQKRQKKRYENTDNVFPRSLQRQKRIDYRNGQNHIKKQIDESRRIGFNEYFGFIGNEADRRYKIQNDYLHGNGLQIGYKTFRQSGTSQYKESLSAFLPREYVKVPARSNDKIKIEFSSVKAILLCKTDTVLPKAPIPAQAEKELKQNTEKALAPLSDSLS